MSPVSSRPVRRNNVHERPAPQPPWSLSHTFHRAGLLCVIVHLGIANLIASNSRFSSFGLGYNGDRAFTKQRKSGRAILFEARRQPQNLRTPTSLEKHRRVSFGQRLGAVTNIHEYNWDGRVKPTKVPYRGAPDRRSCTATFISFLGNRRTGSIHAGGPWSDRRQGRVFGTQIHDRIEIQLLESSAGLPSRIPLDSSVQA
jgi:hypothetical protein